MKNCSPIGNISESALKIAVRTGEPPCQSVAATASISKLRLRGSISNPSGFAETCGMSPELRRMFRPAFDMPEGAPGREVRSGQTGAQSGQPRFIPARLSPNCHHNVANGFLFVDGCFLENREKPKPGI